jgi:hypothetical protein
MVAEYPDVRFYLYDVEECEDVAQELGVRSMPSFSIFKDGDIQVCVFCCLGEGSWADESTGWCYGGETEGD